MPLSKCSPKLKARNEEAQTMASNPNPAPSSCEAEVSRLVQSPLDVKNLKACSLCIRHIMFAKEACQDYIVVDICASKITCHLDRLEISKTLHLMRLQESNDCCSCCRKRSAAVACASA